MLRLGATGTGLGATWQELQCTLGLVAAVWGFAEL